MRNLDKKLAQLPAEKRAELMRRLLQEQRRTQSQAPVAQPITGDQSEATQGAPSTPLPSFSQERLWFVDRLEPGQAAYNMPAAQKLQGPLALLFLERALSELTAHHGVLCVSFEPDCEDRPKLMQHTASAVHQPLSVVDLDGLNDTARKAHTIKLAERFAASPFQLNTPPLWRVLVLRCGHNHHVLMLNMHHIIGDFWSLQRFFSDTAAFYRAHLQRTPEAKPAPALAYHEAADHIRQRWQQGGFADDLAFWRHTLNPEPSPLALPLVSSSRDPRAAHVHVQWSQSEMGAMQRFANASKLSPFMFLLACVKIVLQRWTNQDDLTLGVPLAGRHRPAWETSLGCYVNMIPIRTTWHHQQTAREWLQRVRSATLQGLAHGELPFEKLVEALQPSRRLDRHPLFDVLVNYFNVPTASDDFPHCQSEPMALPEAQAKMLLTLYASERNGHLDLQLMTRATLIPPAVMTAFLDQLRRVTRQILANPDQPVAALSLLPDDWRPTQFIPAPLDWTIPQRLAQLTQQDPDRIALSGDGLHLNYATLHRQALAWAQRLHQSGVQPGDAVGLIAQREPALVIGWLAIWYAGAVVAPLDRDQPIDRQQSITRQANLHCLLSSEPTSWPTDLRCLFLRPIRDAAPTVVPTWPTPDTPAYICFTSGSTGEPKGILGAHRGPAQCIRWQADRFALDQTTRSSLLIAPTFDAVMRDLFLPLSIGGTVVVPPNHQLPAKQTFRDWVSRASLTVMHTVPALAAAWLGNAASQPQAGPRILFLAGEPLTAGLVQQWRQQFSNTEQIVNLYGTTETSLISCGQIVEAADLTPIIPVGKPLPGVSIHIMRAGQPAAVLEQGQVMIGSQWRSLGQVQTANKSDEGIFQNLPFTQDGLSYYASGDRGRCRADGTLEILGRMDRQLKVRGVRIEPAEIEAHLQAVTGVQRAVVVLNTQNKLRAFVQSDEDPQNLIPACRAGLNQRLPTAMIPQMIEVLTDFPLLPNGKINLSALKALPAANALEKQPYAAPRNITEAKLVDIWSAVLAQPKVGIHDNFFDMSGHSLLAIQIISRVQQQLGQTLPLRAVFEAPSVAAMAKLLHPVATADKGKFIPRLVRDRDEPTFPLSFAQERLLFIDQLGQAGAAYNIANLFGLAGPLDVATLETAMLQLQRRHEILRTVFPKHAGDHHMAIRNALPLAFRMIDLRHLPKKTRGAQAQTLADQAAHTVFDLAEGPLWRVDLMRLDHQQHVLALTIHHIISDGWSVAIMIREISSDYSASLTRQQTEQPRLPPLQYADYAAWQRARMQGGRLARQRSYWLEALAEAPPLLELPLDRPRPALQTFAGAIHRFTLAAPLMARLQARSRRLGISLFACLQTAYAILLSRYSNQADVLVGTPVLGRDRQELEAVLGLFVNTVVLRNRLGPDIGLDELLQINHERALAAYEQGELPFEQVVEALQPQRNLSHGPIFQVMFVLQNLPMGQHMDLPGGLRFKGDVADSVTAKFDLNLLLWDTGDGYLANFEYNVDLFEAATIARMAEQYRQLLSTMAKASADQPVDRLRMLTDRERHKVLQDWNQTTHALDVPWRGMHAPFEAQAQRFGDRIATTFRPTRQDVPQQLSYDCLERQANVLAHRLREQGISREVLVAIRLTRSLLIPTVLLAIHKAGGAYVPLDPRYPAARCLTILNKTRAPLLITEEPQDLATETTTWDTWCLPRHKPLSSHWPTPASTSTANIATDPDQLAYVIFTSGSTGEPKGVIVRHRPALNLIRWVHRSQNMQANDRLLFVTSLCFDLSVFDIFGSLGIGANILMPGEATLDDPQALTATLCHEAVTFWDSAPAALHRLAAFFPRLKAMHLRHVFLSGDWIPLNLPDAVKTSFPRARVTSLGGATEATIWSNVFPVKKLAPHWTSVPYGKPIQNARYYVLDRYLEPQPIGVPGDLYIGGDCLSWGYFGQPALTAARYLPDPHSPKPGAVLYTTGDRARWFADGNLEFLGRLDAQVKIRGFRIELGEIESALNAHPAVVDSVVLARGPSREDKRLLAYVRLQSRVASLPDDLMASLNNRLPTYMLPAAVIVMDHWPTTANGKLDRKALPDPDQQQNHREQPPATRLEKTLCDIWTEVLGKQPPGIHSNFFDLGGHSLSATRVLARIIDRYQVELPLQVLFAAPTVAQLAQAIEQSQSVKPPAPPIHPQPADTPKPLSFAQQRLWFLFHLEEPSATYNIPAGLRLSGPLDTAALAAAINTVSNRHDNLRTTFPEQDGEPRQVIDAPTAMGLSLVDLRDIPAGDQHLEQLFTALVHRPFDLQEPPLWRFLLVRMTDKCHGLLLVMHHIIADGWSMGVLVREVVTGYRQALAGHPPELEPLSVQYADFAVWQRRWLQDQVLAEQLAYWQKQLHGAPELHPLPTDRPRPPMQTYRGHTLTFTLQRDLTDQLKHFARQTDTTLFMVLEAILALLIARYGAANDIVLGSPIANRRRQELEPLIGFFVNTLVLRNNLSGNPKVTDLMTRVKTTALDAFANQDVPFEQVVETLQPTRHLDRTPLFQIMLVLQNVPGDPPATPGIVVDDLAFSRSMAKFDLTLTLTEHDDQLTGLWEFNGDLFDQSTMARMLSRFRHLSQALTADPNQQIDSIVLLTEAERHQLLNHWSGDPQNELTLPLPLSRWRKRVHARPHHVVCRQGNRQWTAAYLDRRAQGWAALLAERGVAPGHVVPVHSAQTPGLIAALLGCWYVGCAYAPLGDDWPQARQATIMDDLDVELVLRDRQPTLCRRPWLDVNQSPEPAVFEPVATSPQALAYVIYTSGSSGRPKGVAISQIALAHYLAWCLEQYPWQPGVSSSHGALSFDASVTGLWAPLLAGTTVLPEDGTQTLDHLASLLTGGTALSTLKLTPAHLSGLANVLPTATDPDVAAVVVGGEALQAQVVKTWLQKVPSARVLNEYGPTEATVGCVVHRLQPQDRVTNGDIAIGRPIDRMGVFVVDNNLQLQPPDLVGELGLGGLGLARGYWRDPRRTAAVFVPDPFSKLPGSRLYLSGDMARFDSEGQLHFLGRRDHQLKVRGYRIEAGEVEHVLCRHPWVAEALVQKQQSQQDAKLVAHVLVGQQPHRQTAVTLTDWQVVFDETYQLNAHENLTTDDDYTGWHDSIIGAALPAAAMRRWADETAARILEQSPGKVLEIGCGTGLLLTRIAPQADQYIGLDLSTNALQRAAAKADKLHRKNVSLHHAPAHEIERVVDHAIDTVILNSVVQYFPDPAYLRQVLAKVITRTKEGGRIFIGDVRANHLLTQFHTAVLNEKHSLEDTRWQTVQTAADRDVELTLDPAFFSQMRQKQPRITHVLARLKSGQDRNELTRFRYDITLFLDAPLPAPPCVQHRFGETIHTPDDLVQLLQTADGRPTVGRPTVGRPTVGRPTVGRPTVGRPTVGRPTVGRPTVGRPAKHHEATWHVTDIPNSRMHGHSPDARDPSSWIEALAELPVETVTNWTPASPKGHFDLWIRADHLTGTPWHTVPDKVPNQLHNQPARARALRSLQADLQDLMQQHLPNYMWPASIIPVDRWPTTAHGKIDRRALPEPLVIAEQHAYIAPATEHQQRLAAIWRSVLAVDRIGQTDDFFTLGGHSLLATKVTARIRQQFGLDLPLRVMFEARTLAKLAAHIENTAPFSEPTLPIPRIKTSAAQPLSFAQQRLWFLERLEGSNPVYNMPVALALNGPFAVLALERAWQRLLERQTALRTVFVDRDGQPQQQQRAVADFVVQVIDAPKDGARWLADLLTEEAGRPFVLAQGPLARALLIRHDQPDHYTLLVNTHHAVADGWSMGLLVREWADNYRASVTCTSVTGTSVTGKALQRQPLTCTYADYAAWQRQTLDETEISAHLDWWRAHLTDAPPRLALPYDFQPPRVMTFSGDSFIHQWDQALTQGLRAVAHQEGTTLFSVLLSGYAMLMAKLANQSDIVVGTPVANRERPELEDIIGFFVNTLALRINLEDLSRFDHLLAHVHATILAAHEHQAVPFETVVDHLAPARDLGHTPLFQTLFILQNQPFEQLTLPAVSVEERRLRHATAKFELTFSLSERHEGLELLVEFNRDLFQLSTVKRFAELYRQVLSGIAQSPRRSCASYLHDPTPPMAQAPLHDLSPVARCLRWHQTHPDMIAVADASGASAMPRHLSYAALMRQSGALALQLRKLGAGPERLVAIAMSRSIERVVAVLACLRAGAAYLPLALDLPTARQRWILQDAQPVALLVDTSRQLDHATPEVLVKPERSRRNPDLPAGQMNSDHWLYLLYTSGSTGQPKGVVMPAGPLMALSAWHSTHSATAPGLRTLQFTTLSFDVAFQEMATTWVDGGCLLIVDRETRRDPRQLWRFIIHQHIARVFLPFVALQALAEAAHQALAAGETPPTALQHLVTAGETLQWTAALQQLMTEVPGLQLANHYGPTETHVVTAYQVPADEARHLPPIGTAVAAAKLIVADRRLHAVADGCPGELCIGGSALARGYWQRPGRTAAVFVPDPYTTEPGARLYRTGDLVRRLPQGQLSFLGRTDRQVKHRGFRVEPGEIESQLLKLSSVTAAVVVPIDDSLVAFLAVNQSLNESDIRNHLGQHLPAYMLPDRYIVQPQLPRTRTGKLDRRALASRSLTAQHQTRPSAPPSNVLEATIAEAWTDVLGRTITDVQADFFQMGGHSLRAAQVATRLEAVLHKQVPVRWLFEVPTVAGLAQRLDRATTVANIPLEPSGNDRQRASFAQERLWFLARLNPTDTAYTLPIVLDLSGPLDVASLSQAFAAVIQRHQVLSQVLEETSLAGQDPINQREPGLFARQVDPPRLEMVDLGATTNPTRQAQTLAQQLFTTPFNLKEEPPLRLRLLRLNSEKHHLLVSLHHIAADQWSLGVLVAQLADAYSTAMSGAISAPSGRLQYGDWAAWQRKRLAERETTLLTYWTNKFAKPTPSIFAAADYTPGDNETTNTADGLTTTLSPSELNALRDLAKDHHTTLFGVLLAGLTLLMTRHTGENDICIGTPVAGRNHPAVENLVGCFLNNLVLRTQIDPSKPLGDYLAQIQDNLLDAMAHGDLPFEQLVEAIQPPRQRHAHPLFDVSLNLLNAPMPIMKLPGLSMTPMANQNPGAKTALSLFATETPTGLQLRWVFKRALFNPQRMAWMLEQYTTLLQQFHQASQRRLEHFRLLTPGQLKLLPQPDQTLNHPTLPSLLPSIAKQVRTRPTAVALQAGTTHWTYTQLWTTSQDIAHCLRSKGCRPGDTVALHFTKSPHWVAATLATWMCGGVILNIDPALPIHRQADMHASANTHLILYDHLPPQKIMIDCAINVSGVQPRPLQTSMFDLAPQDDAYIFFTSGSSGRPKAITGSHGGLAHFIAWEKSALAINASVRVACASGITFDAVLRDLGLPLTSGGTLVLPSQRYLTSSAVHWLAMQAISLVHTVPTLASAWLQNDHQALPQLRWLCLAGEPLHDDLVRAWHAMGPQLRIVNFYGPTETTMIRCWHEVEREPPPGLQPAGQPINDSLALVLHHTGRPCGIGEMGEIVLRAPGQTRGYRQQPREQALAFRPDPWNHRPGTTCYHTGDLGRFDAAGCLWVLGRLDAQCKIHGVRLEPAEVESVLCRHPDIQQAGVCLTDQSGRQVLVGLIVTIDEKEPPNLAEHCRQWLPAALIPAVFFPCDILPTLPSGKLDRRGLRNLAEQCNAPSRHTFDKPKTETEHMLGKIWAEVLGLQDATQLDRHDNFFQLGGHSLLALQVLNRLETCLELAIPLRMLMEHPDLMAFSKKLDQIIDAKRAIHRSSLQTNAEWEELEI